MVYYFLNECDQKINGNRNVAKQEMSKVTVGDNGNVDSLLNSLAYELELEEVGEDLVFT